MTVDAGVLDDRYELGEPLGSGGMADVRIAHDRRLDRPVAVKLLRPELAAHDDLWRRFASEASAAARLNHPNVVTVYDTGIADGQPYIVMQLVEGRSLAGRIATGPLPVEDVVRIGTDVLGALGAAHDLGIVHRDIKPGNVLLTEDGTAKVCDFGIAKSAEDLDLTLSGQLLGTPAYMAPERLTGGQATPASDIYSVGVLLFEALTATKPFTGESPVAVGAAVVRGDLTPLSSVRPDLPTDVVAVVEKAMACDPHDRFPSAGEMADVLTRAGASSRADPTMVMPAAIAPTAVAMSTVTPAAVNADGTADAAARRGWLRRPSAVAVLAAAGVLLLALILVASALASDDTREPDRTRVETTTTVPTTTTTTTIRPHVVAPPVDEDDETQRDQDNENGNGDRNGTEGNERDGNESNGDGKDKNGDD